jgi:hypothetical protein
LFIFISIQLGDISRVPPKERTRKASLILSKSAPVEIRPPKEAGNVRALRKP